MVRLLRDFFSEPLAVEALVAAVLTGALWFLLRGLRGIASRISRRKALREFVSGIDSYFKGEYADARDELLKVLERDPENSEARILLGDSYRALGDIAEAHKHHYQVARVFEQDLPRNRLSLGMDLLEMGRVEDAILNLEGALSSDPKDRKTAEALLQASLSAGRFSRAVELARQLAETAEGREEREKWRRRRARICAEAGRALLERGEVREGSQLLKSAVKLDRALVGPRLELVRSAFLNSSPESAEKELTQQLRELSRLADEGGVVFERPTGLRRGGDSGRAADFPGAAPASALSSGRNTRSLPAPGEGREGMLPARVESRPAGKGGGPAAADAPGPLLRLDAEVPGSQPRLDAGVPGPPLRVDAGALVTRLLPREALYLCSECGSGVRDYSERCSSCGAVGSLLALDTTTLTPVPEMEAVFDEIEENRAFVRGQVRRAAEGDAGAAEKLIALGPRVVPGIFREILRVDDSEALVSVLSRLGPEAVPRILEAFRRTRGLSTKRLVREGMRAFRSLDSMVVCALAGMGREVAAAVAPYLDGSARELRQIALDVLVRLGRADRIEELRLSISTKEMLDRLNACPPELLGPLIDAAPPGGFLVRQVFPDRTFGAARAIAEALMRRENREKLRGVLMERGFSPEAYSVLEKVWGLAGARTVVMDIVRAYGRAASDHLIRTCTDESLPEQVREDALRLLLDQGGEEVERLTELLSEGDPETEGPLLEVIRAFGNRAVPALVRCYGKTGLLHRVGLNRRRLEQRKVTLLKALREIGTYEAVQNLKRLHDREGDPDLKRRIADVLETLGEG